jgi:fatty-acid desaturase
MANLPITDGLHDWLIIHRPHHLNVDKFHESIKRRDFRYGEQGWHDLLIRPNNFENNEQTSWLDLVTLRNHRTTDIPRRARIVPHFTEGKHNG